MIYLHLYDGSISIHVYLSKLFGKADRDLKKQTQTSDLQNPIVELNNELDSLDSRIFRREIILVISNISYLVLLSNAQEYCLSSGIIY